MFPSIYTVSGTTGEPDKESSRVATVVGAIASILTTLLAIIVLVVIICCYWYVYCMCALIGLSDHACILQMKFLDVKKQCMKIQLNYGHLIHNSALLLQIKLCPLEYLQVLVTTLVSLIFINMVRNYL